VFIFLLSISLPYLKMFKDILKGYDSLNPLTPEEKQAVYCVLCAANINNIAYMGDYLELPNHGNETIAFFAENKNCFLTLWHR